MSGERYFYLLQTSIHVLCSTVCQTILTRTTSMPTTSMWVYFHILYFQLHRCEFIFISFIFNYIDVSLFSYPLFSTIIDVSLFSYPIISTTSMWVYFHILYFQLHRCVVYFHILYFQLHWCEFILIAYILNFINVNFHVLYYFHILYFRLHRCEFIFISYIFNYIDVILFSYPIFWTYHLCRFIFYILYFFNYIDVSLFFMSYILNYIDTV